MTLGRFIVLRRTRGVLLASVVAGGPLTASCFNPDDETAVPPADAQPAMGNAATEGSASSGGDTGAVCPEYCRLIGDHCQGGNAQYGGDALCEATCAGMPVGAEGDQLGNSANCRTFHAVLAAEDPDTHCLHAGPAGDGTCGADCESFCVLAQSLCGDSSPFASAEACISECEEFPAEPSYSADVPDQDSFACRLRHLTLASLQPEIHCSHVTSDSPVCFD